jgi:hypothetical protein
MIKKLNLKVFIDDQWFLANRLRNPLHSDVLKDGSVRSIGCDFPDLFNLIMPSKSILLRLWPDLLRNYFLSKYIYLMGILCNEKGISFYNFIKSG